MESKAEYATKALPVAQPLTPQTWQMIEQIAPAMHAARFFGVSNAEQAMAIMLKGFELGLSLAASFDLIQVIQGRPALSPRGALALIQQSPLCTRLEIVDEPGACTVTMERSNGFSYSLTWTIADAQQAGLVKPGGGWEKYPANMLRWRAVGFCADVVFPDVIGGMKCTDELGADLDQDGNTIIDTTWDVVPSELATQVISDPQVTNSFTTIDQLIAVWTPDQIMEANEGRIPATEAECLAVATKLGAQNPIPNGQPWAKEGE
jgi:hypothetical protein